MAPEQARDAKHADPRSDLYALGCVLYHMLTGQFPFRAPSSLEVILTKIEGRFKPARELNPDIPPELDAVVTLMLAAHPDERYQSATDLVNELEELDLAHPTLQFLREYPEPTSPAGGAAPTPQGLPTRSEPKGWFVLYRTPKGRWVTRRLATHQVLRAMKSEHFALTAQASRSRGEYRFLSGFPEFHDLLAARHFDGAASKAEESAGSPASSTAAPRPPLARVPRAPDSSRRRWRLLLGMAIVILAIAGLGFWLGQLLVR